MIYNRLPTLLRIGVLLVEAFVARFRRSLP